ncbi:DUF3558 domain-containing protein [Streptomyces sp. 8N706]|uniref:DUF3558 domain-containing protein n=1 Tax=Streptomyces sp. 8N706 TaxID=3457416 RepID=UPI003FD25D03
MPRTAPPLARLLACAAVIPAMLVAGCSLDSGSDAKNSDSGGASKSAKPSASPTVAAAKYGKLPQPCETIAKKTVEKLVPKAKSPGGTTGKSADTDARGTCSWNGLDGFQYRWLDVSLQRFDSDPTLGSGESRAKDAYAKQAGRVKSVSDTKGVKGLRTGTAPGVGDEATTVRYDLKKDGDGFKNQTLLVRSANVVITLNYNGAGYETGKTPKAEDLLKDAQGAAKEVVAAVADANTAGGKGGTSDKTDNPSGKASDASGKPAEESGTTGGKADN